jgi:hypothetical protein
MNSPEKLNLPSYCKMLAYEIQDCRQGSTKKIGDNYGDDIEGGKGGRENFRIRDFDMWNDMY